MTPMRTALWRTVAVSLMLVLPGCGGGGGDGGPTGSSNGSPSGNLTATPSGPVLLAATAVRFTATATDPDGDAITYNWNFGDGTTASGATVTHVFNSAGSLNVVLTLSDSKGAQSTAQNIVVVKSLTGRWVDADPRFQVELTQNGATFTGSVTVSGFGPVSNISDGAVSDPRAVAFHRESFVRGFATVDYRGSLDASLDKMNVVAVQNSATTFNLTRQ